MKEVFQIFVALTMKSFNEGFDETFLVLRINHVAF